MIYNKYVEFFYPYNPDVANSMEDTHIKQVQETNPLLFKDDVHGKIGFRFFEVGKNLNQYIKGNRVNVSPIYYNGRYMSLEEIDYVHKIMPYTKEITRMIECYCGYMATDLNKDDTTLEEYENKILSLKNDS